MVDISFDVRTDAGGRDPDSHSASLRGFHRALWSKPLPSGAMFDLDEQLRHVSALGEFHLASGGYRSSRRAECTRASETGSI